MAASFSLSFKPFFSSVATDSKDVSSGSLNWFTSGFNWWIFYGFTPGNFVPSFVDFGVSTGLAKALIPRGKRLLCRNKFQLNCSVDRDMDVSTSAMVDGTADCVNEVELKEPSISTMLMNFENKFDPYDAMSTLLYQTATFKQPSATENGTCDYTRSGNPTRDALERSDFTWLCAGCC